MIAQISTVAFFAGLAAAVHAPVGDPLGNPITAPLIEVRTPNLQRRAHQQHRRRKPDTGARLRFRRAF